jgi:hypothetical protein
MVLIRKGTLASVPGGRSLARASGVARVPTPLARHASCISLAEQANTKLGRPLVGKILIGVIIGVILMIWLLASCVGAIF